MKKLFKILLLSFLLLTISLNGNSNDYYLVDDYISDNKQEEISKSFIQTIQDDAVAIKKQNKNRIKIMLFY